MSEEDAREALSDAVALWEVRASFGPDEVISSAVAALVAGVDSPTLRELAGATPKDDYWTLRPLVDDTLDELGIPRPRPGTDEIQIAATRVMCKRLLSGGLCPRELARWAHTTIGHEGAPRLQPLVELDDAYDVTEYTGDTFEDLEKAARAEAISLVAGEPVQIKPRPPSRLGPVSTSAPTISGLRAVIRRLRGSLRT